MRVSSRVVGPWSTAGMMYGTGLLPQGCIGAERQVVAELSLRYRCRRLGPDLECRCAVRLHIRLGGLVVGYRYLSYDFDSDFKLMKELDIYGPVIGAAWEF